MAVRYTYLALEKDHQLVVDWFSAIPDEVSVSDRVDRLLYYYRSMTAIPLPLNDKIDQEKTPLVFVEKPQRRLGTLWTNAEVFFTPTPLRSQFPGLQKISRSFAKWLNQFDLVYSQNNPVQSEWNYFLEAGIQNFAEELYALPHAMAALRAGQYFVHHRANSAQLNLLAKSLQLRGYPIEMPNGAAQTKTELQS